MREPHRQHEHAPSWARALDEKLDGISASIQKLSAKIGRYAVAERKRDLEMSAETKAAFEEVKADAAAEGDAVTAIGIVIDKLVEMIQEPGVTLADVKALGAQLKSQKDALAAAIVKGTPAEPAPETGARR